jgi:cystathionine beta-synthase
MRVHHSILDAIGRTPLVELTRVTAGLPVTMLAKVEYLNPGGSVKDRIGLAMVEEAERAGLLAPGGTIVEATAGNTGVGLALAAAIKGYRCIFAMPDKMSADKVSLLKAYGAEVVITPTAVAPDSPESYNGVADRLAREIPGAWRPNQFANMQNPEAHYRTTGPEIWEDTEGRVGVFVAGMGTGGTISGIGRYLKERNPSVRVIGADPEGSILSGDTPRPYLVEGIGEDFVPATYDRQVVDDMVRVSDAESFHMARRLAREEGLLVGGSSGTAVVAAVRYARRLEPGTVVVVLLPDTGRNYLSKIFSDEWLEEKGLMAPPEEHATAGDVLRIQRPGGPMPTVTAEDGAMVVVQTMRRHGLAQLPVVKDGRIVGSVTDLGLMQCVRQSKDGASATVAQAMAGLMPQVSDDTALAEAYRLLMAGHGAVVVTHEGGPVGLLTRTDLVEFWGTDHNHESEEGTR